MPTIYKPFPLSQLTQRFGENANDSYSAAGLKGHTSYDFYAPYNERLDACTDGLVYSVINKNNPDPERYRAVFQIVEAGGYLWEVSYGHMNEIHVQPNQYVYAGQQIGTVGNTGNVYENGVYVTKEARLAGSKKGTHLHGPQLRKCRWVSQPHGQLLYDGYGPLKYKGGYVEILDYTNGYNGCVDYKFQELTTSEYRAQVLPKLQTVLTLVQRLLSMLRPNT